MAPKKFNFPLDFPSARVTMLNMNSINVAISIYDDHHAADLLVPKGADAAYQAAAEAAGVNLLLTSDDSEAAAWQGGTPWKASDPAYWLLYSVLDCPAITTSSVVNDGVRTVPIDEDGEILDMAAMLALLDSWGVDHSEAEYVAGQIALRMP